MNHPGFRYSRGAAKRALDLVLVVPALAALLPVGLIIAASVLVTSGPPVLFRHQRVGRDGRPFRLLKFRSMRHDTGGGLPITGGGDPRVTGLGRVLRRTKLDEIPQLLNVLAGQMSLVGPRPEVARYVALYDERQREILRLRPGLTDPASLAYRDEEAVLGAVPETEREAFYIREVMPRKLALSLDYAGRASLFADIRTIARTALAVLLPGGR